MGAIFDAIVEARIVKKGLVRLVVSLEPGRMWPVKVVKRQAGGSGRSWGPKTWPRIYEP